MNSFRKKAPLPFILFLFFGQFLFSQKDSDPGGFRHITVRDGLPSSEVYKVIQDHLGYMWMCTDAGVCRYNGYNFQSFTTRDGLTDNTVFRLKEDLRGRIWAQGFSGALSYFDGIRFNPIRANDSLVAIFSNGQKISFSMEVDSLGGVTVGGLFTKGCYRVGPEDNYAVPHKVKPAGVPYDSILVWSLINAKGHSFAYMTANTLQGTFVNNGITTTIDFSALTGTPSHNIVYQTKNNKVVFTYYNQLYVIDPEGNFESHDFRASIIGLNEDRDGNFWVSTLFGGTHFIAKGNFNNPSTIYLQGKTVGCVYQDNENGYWFSTVGEGIYYLPDRQFAYLTPTEGLSQSTIQNIAPYKEHEMIIGLANGVISIVNPKLQGEQRIKSRLSMEKNNLPTEAIITIHDSIYVSTRGILLLDSNLQTLNSIDTIGHHKGGIRNATTGYMMFYSHSNLSWISPKFKLDSFQYTKIRFTAACYGNDGSIWLGALNGLWKLRGNTPVYLGDSANGIKARIDGICQDKNGVLWIATRGEGVFAIYGKQKWHFGEEEGLAANTCRSITLDKSGGVWVGTNHGITIIRDFDLKSGNANLRSFNTTHGLLSDEVKFIICHDEQIWMGSNEGLCWIPVSSLMRDSVAPPVYITNVFFGKDSCDVSRTCDFNYSDNTIRIFAEGLCFRDPAGIRYKYRMIGGDTQWITTANREIHFAGLSPGEYRLEIKAINSDGVESKLPAVFSFRILAPFWRTWWFILILILSLIGLVWMWANFRLKIKQQRVKEKAETEKRIAELRLSALRAQMNPHFIFNAINSIQHFVLQNDSEQAYNYLAKFSRLIRLVLDQSQSETIPLSQELKMLDLYIELEQLRFERPFTYSIDVDRELLDENKKVPGMLIQPFVENAIWHGLLPKEKGEAWIKISMKKKGSFMEIIIEDNGVGRKTEVQPKPEEGKRRSYGLQITEERLRLSENKNSDQPVIHINDLKDDSGNQCGTKVIIQIASDDYDE